MIENFSNTEVQGWFNHQESLKAWLLLWKPTLSPSMAIAIEKAIDMADPHEKDNTN